MAYIFRIGPMIFIFNVQYSKIGASYPRLFVAWPDGSYTNIDLYLGCGFPMSEDDWYSWFDDELIDLNDIEDVRRVTKEAGINWDPLEEVCFKLLEKHR